ncbi:MAG: PHP domain-containing protein [Candidatus Nealsonbacteria bacterium]|nr:PHP domain-containing protein [Candidatus Nealsonbacteria bacterium]
MANIIDLQIQSTASDGKNTPRELVSMAQKTGLEVMALTDHDTVAGLEEALAAGQELGIRVIPGIEISAEEHGVHILGYGIDYRDPKLLEITARFKEERTERAKKILNNLKTNEGFIVEWEDVLREAKDAATITSPHVVYAVINRKENQEKLSRDGVKNKQDFYEKYLADSGPNEVKREHFSAQQAIELIHSLGGVAIWSHPAIHFLKNYDQLEKFLTELLAWKIDGLEVFSPSHTEDDVEFLTGLVQKYFLLRTAGSDFHASDPASKPNELGLHSAQNVGDFNTYGFSTDDIIPRLDDALARWRAQAN